ncbi:alpha/beta hydrolase [Streptomyces nojiriensis]|uniref:Alpha/beta hydrolase n=1 Tax=Streptomyces nojiriensis TaxID=66374 RepID=A0ABQ3T1A1_9ACTN|nr:alpha/beta hydrolase [Streptomyces nojiriensis]QTI47668.1 Epoxide hydrolase B [Streptomyces nojiriensis]GGR76361.1 alpha/beta hydrolase [Streptomyces nojiriensis]GHI74169.1 alpha/beta hydrolase [Streptomyces nojiriensis]
MSKPPRLTLPSAARAYLLTTDRGSFAVHEAGEPVRGTALLVPGFTGSKEDFIGLLEPLAAAGYRVVAVDGRGQHETPGPREEAPYALEELARDVLAQVRALGADRVHLVGHSLGGLISRAAVLRDPSPFASLTLMSSGPAAISEDQQARTKLLVAALEAMGDDMPGIWAAMRAHDPEDAAADSPELAHFLRERWLATVPEQLIVTGRTLISEPDRIEELSRVELSKLVLSGAVDQAWPVPLLDETARRLAARRVIVPGTDHSPNAEDPATTARELAAFWDSCTGL